MKIVSYNINDCQLWKIEKLLGLEADVLVAPEITCPEDANLPKTLDMKWCGIGSIISQWVPEQSGFPTWVHSTMQSSRPACCC